MIIDTYVIVAEMPKEIKALVPLEEMSDKSLMRVLEEMQSRYTMGFNFSVPESLVFILFQKESERDFAYNELRNCGFDALRMESTIQTESEHWTEEGQAKLKEANEKWLKKTEKRIRKWEKRNGKL